jgi:tetratricopeptide (TPR) repeat protein
LLSNIIRLFFAASLVAASLAPTAAQEALPFKCNDLVPPAALADAIEACTAAIGGEIESMAEAHRRRGVLLRRSGEFEKAIADFDIALGLRPAWVQAGADKGRALIGLERYAEARLLFMAVILADERYGPAHSGLGWVYESNNNLEGAFEEYSRAFELDPSDWHALVARGITAYWLGRPLEALSDLDTAAAADPGELKRVHTTVVDDWNIDFPAEIEVKRASVLFSLGRFGETIDTYRALLARYPTFYYAALKASDFMLSIHNDKVGALALLSEAAAHSPDAWEILVHMARIHALVGDDAAARAILSKVRPPSPENGLVSFYHDRSKVWRVLGEYGSAISDVMQGGELAPRYLASVAISMEERGYLMDSGNVSPRERFQNALQACMRDFECAYWD